MSKAKAKHMQSGYLHLSLKGTVAKKMALKFKAFKEGANLNFN